MDAKSVRTVTSTELAKQTGEILNQVHYGKAPAVITRRDRPIVLMLPVEEGVDLQNAIDQAQAQ
jgi:prevent-host-death family protein